MVDETERTSTNAAALFASTEVWDKALQALALLPEVLENLVLWERTMGSDWENVRVLIGKVRALIGGRE